MENTERLFLEFVEANKLHHLRIETLPPDTHLQTIHTFSPTHGGFNVEEYYSEHEVCDIVLHLLDHLSKHGLFNVETLTKDQARLLKTTIQCMPSCFTRYYDRANAMEENSPLWEFVE